MMKSFIFTHVLLFACFVTQAQYAPQAGLLGSLAMYKDSSAFVDWASNCTIARGWLDIADTSLGKASIGSNSSAFGKADGDVLSLGDAGEAVLFFENPIVNELGVDFAVFENGFRNPADSNLAYLELAQVEVSNDGLTYYGFASASENDTTVQIAGAGEYMDARKLNNLAGKYIAGYGTPFELDELNGQIGLDLNNIHYVKIKDVVGSLDEVNCVRDFNHHKINDPYPTPFPGGGFDLDAIGIIHQKYPTGVSDLAHVNATQFYPNPTKNILNCKSTFPIQEIEIYSLDGKRLLQQTSWSSSINISSLNNGNYIATVFFKNGNRYHQLILKDE